MWPLLIVLADPQIEVGLQFVDRTIHLFTERDTIELVEHGLVKALTDTVMSLQSDLPNRKVLVNAVVEAHRLAEKQGQIRAGRPHVDWAL